MKNIKPEQITDNTFKLVGKDWMLITAGNKQGFNTMTASWGGFGVIWGKNICWIVVRPNRYTYGFVEKYEYFSLCFFSEKYRDALNFCGSKSGRDVDKIKQTGLTPAETAAGNIYFSEARLVIECRKIYYSDIDPAHFIDPSIDKNYPARDYHRMFIGEIVQCLSVK